MAWTRRKQLGSCRRHVPNNSLEQLASQYMELCNVDSSSGSESEVSPRWSDTSPMECGSSASETRSGPRTRPVGPKAASRHDCHSMFLDPYDGSSEDSDVCMEEQSHRRTTQGRKSTGCWCSARNRRLYFPPPPDLISSIYSPAPCGRPSDLQEDQEAFTDDSVLEGGVHLKPGWSHMKVDSSSERSPSPSNLHKRKLGLPFGADLLELGQKKLRQCVFSLELDSETRL